jgi:hypothetical protein
MKGYIGTKIVLALAMTRLAYNQYRGWEVPANEDGNDAGYLVEYTDGGKPNVVGHAGYVSWSPKEQFDGGYIEIGEIGGLDPFRVRLLGERAQLSANLEKLKTFLAGDAVKPLSDRAKGLLVRQLYAQQDLLYILDQRLALIDIEAEQARLEEAAERQRQADLAEADQHQQEHEQALEDAAKLKAESLKADEPLPPADPVE